MASRFTPPHVAASAMLRSLHAPRMRKEDVSLIATLIDYHLLIVAHYLHIDACSPAPLLSL